MTTQSRPTLLHVRGGVLHLGSLPAPRPADVPPWTCPPLVQHVVRRAVGGWAPLDLTADGLDLLLVVGAAAGRPAVVDLGDGRIASAAAVASALRRGPGRPRLDGVAHLEGLEAPRPLDPVIGATMTADGVLLLTFGPAHTAFAEVFADSVGAMAPLGSPPGYATDFINAALARLDDLAAADDDALAVERAVAGGNATALVRVGARIRAESASELFDPEVLPIQVVREALEAYRDAVAWARRSGSAPPPDRNPPSPEHVPGRGADD